MTVRMVSNSDWTPSSHENRLVLHLSDGIAIAMVLKSERNCETLLELTLTIFPLSVMKNL